MRTNIPKISQSSFLFVSRCFLSTIALEKGVRRNFESWINPSPRGDPTTVTRSSTPIRKLVSALINPKNGKCHRMLPRVLIGNSIYVCQNIRSILKLLYRSGMKLSYHPILKLFYKISTTGNSIATFCKKITVCKFCYPGITPLTILTIHVPAPASPQGGPSPPPVNNHVRHMDKYAFQPEHLA
jgi:hypothetical protein